METPIIKSGAFRAVLPLANKAFLQCLFAKAALLQ